MIGEIFLPGVLFGLLVPFIFGNAVYTFFFQGQKNLIERVSFAFGLGFGIITTILFVGNAFLDIQFTQKNFLFIGLLLLLFPVINFIRNFNLTKINKPSFYFGERDIFINSSLIIISFFLIVILYKALFFPTCVSDYLLFGGPISKQMFLTGNLPMEFGSSWVEHYNAYPMHVFMQWLWMYVLNGEFNDMFTRIFSPIYGILIISLTYDLSKKFVSNRLGPYVSVLLLLSNSFFVIGFIDGEDITVAFYTLLAAYLLYKYLGTAKNEYLIFSGVMAGLSATVKQTGLISIIVIYIAFLLFKNGQTIKGSIQFLAPLAIVASPVYLRNFLVLGNPVYPYLYSFFGGKNLDPWIMETLHSFFSPGITLYHLELLPFLLLIGGTLPLSLLLLSILNIKRESSDLKFLYLIVFLYALIWYLTLVGPWSASIRFLHPVMPMIAIIGSRILLGPLGETNLKIKYAILLLLTLGLIFWVALLFLMPISALHNFYAHTGANWQVIVRTSIAVVLLLLLLWYIRKERQIEKQRTKEVFILGMLTIGLIIPAGYLNYINYPLITPRNLNILTYSHPSDEEVLQYCYESDLYTTQEWMDKNLPDNSKILTFQFNSYYLDLEILPADSYRLKADFNGTNIKEILTLLKSLNVTHVLDHTTNRSPLYPHSTIIKNLNNPSFFKLIYRNGDYSLYEIQYSNLK